MRAALGAVLMLSLGCLDSTLCNLAYYYPGVTVELPGETLGEAPFDVDIVADGYALAHRGVPPGGFLCATCVVAVPLRGGGELRSEMVLRTLHVFADAPGRISGGPRELTLTLSRDGDVLASASFRPDYKLEEPNGEGCGAMARATVTLEP